MSKWRFVGVFHGAKVEGVGDLPAELGANPPMTVAGMMGISDLLPIVQSNAPYSAFFTSRLARAVDAASVLALALDLDYQTMSFLGQYGNKDGKTVIMYPGHEGETVVDWQRQGLQALDEMRDQTPDGGTILFVSHRPIIGGIVAWTRGITEEAGITEVLCDPALTKDGLVIFEPNGTMGLKVVPLA